MIAHRSALVVCLVIVHVVTTFSASAGVLWWRQPEQEDVAAVHVGLQSIAPFEEYLDALQPKFSITAEKAIEDAIAQTRAHDSSSFAAILASLAVRFPEISDVLSETVSGDGKSSSTETQRTQSEAPGELSDAVAPTALTRTLTATLPSTTTSVDPILKYRTAAALMQEVTLLSTYVRDAAIGGRTKPYVVRLLVTMFPTNSRQSYDAYTTISFFTKASGDGVLAPAHLLALDEMKLLTDPIDIVNRRVLDEAKAVVCQEKPLAVVPLFVTDNVESSLHSDSLERVRDVALAVQGVWGNTRAGGGFRSQRDDLDKTLARNLNSLMTVARLNDNTLQIRLGAMYGNREDTMVPRTFNVTALVLFPTAQPRKDYIDGRLVQDTAASDVLPCRQGLYTAQTTLRNTRTGRVASVDRGYRMARRLKEAIGGDLDHADRLLALAAVGDFEEFKALRPTDAAQLWPQALAIVHGTSLTTGTFEAPSRYMQFFSNQTNASVIDDGKASRITLTGAINVLPARLTSTLRVKTKDGKRSLYLAPSEISVGSDGRAATLVFPSVKKLLKDDVGDVFIEVLYGNGPRDWQSREYANVWSPKKPAQYASTALPTTRIQLPLGDNPDDQPIGYFPVEEEKKEQPDAEFTMTASSRIVVSDKGTGAVKVALKHKKEGASFPMYLGITGADILASDPPLSQQGVDLSTSADGLYKLTLGNLMPGATVSLKSWRIDNKGSKDHKVIPGGEASFEVRSR